MRSGVTSALIAALLFGASTPFAKLLLQDVPPVLLAGLLYAGSGLGLAIALLIRTARAKNRLTLTLPPPGQLRWLAAAIVAGGVAAPVLLLLGLQRLAVSQASLLLNLEGALTALLAWFVFHENVDRRVALGMAAILGGGVLLAWSPGAAVGLSAGALLVAGASACWALDNNLTRKVAAHDAMAIACAKGLASALVNLALAAVLGARLPSVGVIAASLVVGFVGYGVSLVLFVVSLRRLGAARTAAYFSLAPFFGAALAVVFGGEPLTVTLLAAATLMGIGVWLHVTERHEHEHLHEALQHEHPHTHDEHHWHEHDFYWDGSEPHTHLHAHARQTHSHAHYPDAHHQHDHRGIDSSR